MNSTVVAEPKPIRLLFELARADNPRLYDELVRFQQGSKRVNRLRLLAHDGLLVQQGALALAAERGKSVTPESTGIPPAAALTNALFDPALTE
ncbi:hypothetical protein [Pseudorhodoferax sp.]|uniref:hypothetical protein n=1 Tax=Pseudorhodoferax sp. TaxID=1993553 RepID=UPI002DD65D74|nr:hypothetical protein [Pseudorhodoferax sp.]